MDKIKQFKFKFDMNKMLLIFAIIPMLITAITLSTVAINISSKELKQTTHNSLLSTIIEIGDGLNASIDNNEEVMRAYATAPVITSYLLNPNDSDLAEKAQQFTIDYFGQLEGWEGIYLADWNSKVLTHPAPPVIGKVMREGDALESLHSGMLNADSVYNVGIIESPASGQRIVSMYYPIYHNDEPIGYVGGGTFINEVAADFQDVSALGLTSAYVYMVDNEGIMLFHPDESKIGNSVENEAVKGVIARIEKGETVKPECVEYLYKGAMKYAAYYVGKNNSYVAILTADESDALSTISVVTKLCISIAIALIAVFTVLAIILSKKISKPMTKITEAMEITCTGDLNANLDISSILYETKTLIDSTRKLQKALKDSIGTVINSSTELNQNVLDVDENTNQNVDNISQINEAIGEVAQTSQSVSQNAQTLAERALDLGENVDTLSQSVDNLAKASAEIKAANDEATKYMSIVLDSSSKSVSAVETISQEISRTNEAVSDIQSCISVINDIASETKLLSLNASIEAARAGESGRGFAVVAQSIKSLAESSSQNVEKITDIINRVTELSTKSVKETEKVRSIIEEEQKYISDTQSKFETLSSQVDSSITEIQSIARETKNLSSIKNDLSEATSDLSAISEELGASAEEVSASCNMVTDALADTQSKTGHLNEVNTNLNSAVEFFKL